MDKLKRLEYVVQCLADQTFSNQTSIDAIEFRRESYGFNRREFSELLGIRPSHYSEFTSNKRTLPKKAIRRAIAMGVPPLCALGIN